mgnify:CR=1 FL=1
MSKQDRQGARTVTDLERRLNTRKTFAEAMGLAKDAKKTAEAASEQAKKAQESVDGIDHEAVWTRLTEDGKQQGLFKENGVIYAHVQYLKGGTIAAELIDGSTLVIKKGAVIAGWDVDGNSIFKTPAGSTYGKGTFMSTGTNNKYKIGGSGEISGWVFGAGGKFGVTKDGVVYADDVHLQGEINATDGSFAGEIKAYKGSIGDWHIGKLQYISDYYDGTVLYSDMKYESQDHTQYGVALTPRELIIYGRNSIGDAVTEPVSWYDIAFGINKLK